MSNEKKIALISTLYTQAHGGVYTKLSFLVRVLQEMNYQVILAYYLPYSVKPELSVPLRKLFQKKPEAVHFIGELGIEEYAIGAVLPELEFLNYFPNQHWKKLIEISDLHIVVSGHILSALPFYICKKKYIAWIGTAYSEDRCDRIKTFPWYRKCLDYLLISKIGKRLEKKLLCASNNVFAVSQYTQRKLKQNQQTISGVIPAPIDATQFFPVYEKIQPGYICFTGRFLDPRKNTALLFSAFSIVLKKINYAKLCLIGDEITPILLEKLDSLNIKNHVEILNYISREELVEKLQKADVFVIPSFQEGLCISGLEAMACGCPVVSTRCGGPSDYVIDGKNGYLTDFSVAEFSNKIIQICENRELRNKMSMNALMIIQKNYSTESIKKKWAAAIQREFT